MNLKINNPQKIYDTLFIITFASMVILVTGYNSFNNLNPPIMNDEVIYGLIIDEWNVNGSNGLIHMYDNKPLTYIALQRLLHANHTVDYTRMLNFALIVFISMFMYHCTKRIESCAFIIIPWFLNSMWLTVEIIEVTFILLGLKYAKYQGIFVGLASVFRPYAVIYSLLLKEKKQFIYVGIIGLSYVIFAYYYGILGFYTDRVYSYAFLESSPVLDIVGLTVLVPMAIIGKNSKIFKWGLLGTLPLFIRTYGHYFLVPYTLFFLSYLCSKTANSPLKTLTQPNNSNNNNNSSEYRR